MRCRLFTTLFLFSCALLGQEPLFPGFDDRPRADSLVRVVFWNVENLFDTSDDSSCNDNDFLPTGDQQWTDDRYFTKRKNLAKTLGATGGWELPGIIGLAEVENREAVEGLFSLPPLKKGNYKVVHYDSPDPRCIDVALAYRPDKLTLLSSASVSVRKTAGFSTRDILVASFRSGKDTLHFLVNHWPSRRGGEQASEPKRIEAAEVVRHVVDSLFARQPHAGIIIMGDFNDYSTNRSIRDVLMPGEAEGTTLINLADGLTGGSHAYRGIWDYLDQILVSQSLAMRIRGGKLKTFDAPWLFESESGNLKKNPYRTFAGPRYLGGYSDHLPVYMDLRLSTHIPED